MKELIERLRTEGGDDWSGGVYLVPGELAEEAADSLESQARTIEELTNAIWEFKPSGQVAFLWQINGARPGEVERYRDAYQALLTALSKAKQS